uniref:Serglycin n=1 Tax=Gallus gallus TaxID=9031 RepID=A0A8V0ZRY6_CHICK
LSERLFFCLWQSVGRCAPAQRARYKRVRCRPDAWSPNCVEETGPWFQLPDGAANRILPPLANPALMKTYQELGDAFPLSEEQSGSGWDAALEMASGSGAEVFPVVGAARRPELPAELGQRLQEEALLP